MVTTIRSDQKKQLNQASVDGNSVQCSCPQKKGAPSNEQKKKGINIEINIIDVFNTQYETNFPNHLKLFKDVTCKIFPDTGDEYEEKTLDKSGKVLFENVFVDKTFKIELIQPPAAYEKSPSAISYLSSFASQSMDESSYLNKDDQTITIVESLSDTELEAVDYKTKKKMIKNLEDGYTGDPELNALKKIYKNYNVQTDSDLLEYALDATIYFTADNRAALIVETISKEKLYQLPLSTKKRFIKEIEDGWTSHPEENKLKKIYASYNNNADEDLLEYAIDQTDYANIDDRADLIVNSLSIDQQRKLPFSTKKRLILELEAAWTSDDECDSIQSIYESYQSENDSTLFEYALDQTDYANIDDRSQLIIESLSSRQIKSLPLSSKKRLIKELESAWTSGDELNSIKKIYSSYQPEKDSTLFEYALDQTDYANVDDRSLDIVNSLSDSQISNMPLSSKDRLIEELEAGWTSGEEQTAIKRLKSLK